MRQTIRKKLIRLAVHPRHKTPVIRTRKKDKSKNKKIKENQRNIYIEQRKTTSEPIAAVGDTSSIGIFHLLCSWPRALLPCLPPPAYFRPPRFPFYSSCCPPAPHIPLVTFPPTPPVAPPTPIFLGTTHGGCAALPTQLCLILVPPCHEPFGCFKDPRIPLPRFFLPQWTTARSQLQTPRGSVPLTLRWLGTP